MSKNIPNLPLHLQRKPSLRKIIREAIQAVRIKDGDLVLLRVGSRLAREVNTNALAEGLSRQGYGRCIVAVVQEFDDLTVLNEAEMNKHGWQRITPDEEKVLPDV